LSSRQDVEGRVNVGIRRLIAGSVLNNERIAKEVGLRLPDMQALSMIALAEDQVTPKDVSAATGLPSSSTTRVLDRLEQAGYVRRVADPADRRTVRLEIVQDKLTELQRHYAEISAGMDKHNSRFGVGELETVARYLEELTAQ
jgi:DNA-binding MarR family transcriptional regulator